VTDQNIVHLYRQNSSVVLINILISITIRRYSNIDGLTLRIR